MRAPLSWLRESVDIPAQATAREVLDDLVRVGLEDEDLHGFDVTGPVVVGQVLERTPEPQSNGKTISWCQVRVAPEGQQAADGGADVRGIVCGAQNFEVGDKVVATLPGAVLPGDFRISPRKTYGHVSDGMLASAKELGLGEDHSGIIVLSRLGLDPEVGTPAMPLLGLDEQAVEVNVTPDRGYAMSMRGLAREYANATGAAFRDPALRPELEAIRERAMAATPDAVRVPVQVADELAVREQAMCPIFAGFVVTGVDGSRPTPPWMTARLQLAGIRSLGLLIDITNYVMLELGQPIHGYDLDRLQGGIRVRRATEGEQLTTLDGKQRTLSAEDIVICDDRGPIGLAGTMGGAETELEATTTNVFIEAAGFAPISIARTARRHKLPSEASRRFERGVDPEVAVPAGARVAELLVELAGGTLEPAGVVVGGAPERESIVLRESAPAARMGVEYTRAEILASLQAVGCEVWEEGPGILGVRVPSWRPDLTDEVTLVEEVGRVCGFDRIPSELPVAPSGRGLTREQRLRRKLSDALAASGAVEVLSYPFTAKADNDLFGMPDEGEAPAVKLANALDPETAWLRTSMLPGLLGVAHRNVSRGLTDLAIFELGTVFRPVAGTTYGLDEVPPVAQRPSDARLRELDASLPPQPRWLGAVLLGSLAAKQPGRPAVAATWEDAIELAELAGHAVAAELEFRQGSHEAFHPGRCAEVLVRDAEGLHPIGFAGELHPDVSAERDLPGRVAAVDLDVDAMLRHARREVVVERIVGFPAATQDLSLVVPIGAIAGEVLAAVREGAGELLEDIQLVDDYRGQGLEGGEKSLTFALRFRAPDRTLTAAEATEAKEAGAALAGERFGASIRA